MERNTSFTAMVDELGEQYKAAKVEQQHNPAANNMIGANDKFLRNLASLHCGIWIHAGQKKVQELNNGSELYVVVCDSDFESRSQTFAIGKYSLKFEIKNQIFNLFF